MKNTICDQLFCAETAKFQWVGQELSQMLWEDENPYEEMLVIKPLKCEVSLSSIAIFLRQIN